MKKKLTRFDLQQMKEKGEKAVWMTATTSPPPSWRRRPAWTCCWWVTASDGCLRLPRNHSGDH
jgi:hypothetical protein